MTEALVILVGMTANGTKRKQVLQYCSRNLPYDVFLPVLPQRLGVRWCSRRLGTYLDRKVHMERYSRVHFLNYISGGVIFRYLSTCRPLHNVGRVVYDRGPVQEEVPRALMKRCGKLPLLVLGGKTVTDLATRRWDHLRFPASLGEQGLVVEMGVSSLAKFLRLSPDDLPPGAWDRERLLASATDVVEVLESHDDVYSSPVVLSAICKFLEHGKFFPSRA